MSKVNDYDHDEYYQNALNYKKIKSTDAAAKLFIVLLDISLYSKDIITITKAHWIQIPDVKEDYNKKH